MYCVGRGAADDNNHHGMTMNTKSNRALISNLLPMSSEAAGALRSKYQNAECSALRIGNHMAAAHFRAKWRAIADIFFQGKYGTAAAA